MILRLARDMSMTAAELSVRMSGAEFAEHVADMILSERKE